MAETTTAAGRDPPPATATTVDDSSDEPFMVRDRPRIQRLLRCLQAQRALIDARIGGGEQRFPTAILDLDGDGHLLLDTSAQAACNRAAEQAGVLLCFAQLDNVLVRFRAGPLQQAQAGRHAAFRAALPSEVLHLQRRQMYRLETPLGAAPHLLLPSAAEASQALALRVLDLSGGGLSVALPAAGHVLALQQRCEAVLRMPDGPDLQVALVVCNARTLTLANGLQVERVGLRFAHLPRGGDAIIQRYIFRIDRQRSARRNGEA